MEEEAEGITTVRPRASRRGTDKIVEGKHLIIRADGSANGVHIWKDRELAASARSHIPILQ
jgi:hypothetical protein